MSRVHPSGCPTDIKNYLLCAFGTVIFSNFDNMERSLYESRLKAARDAYAQKEWALEKGLLQGREEGMQQGMQQGLQKGREEGKAEGEAKARKELFALLDEDTLREVKKKLKIS